MTKVLKHRNHKMVGVTDIENIQGFTQIKNSKRNGMDVFYGIQLALNDNQPLILYPNDSLLADNKYVVLDIETTGLNREEDKIIQIAAVKIENGVVIESFERLINPEIEVPQFIYDLTHLDPKAIENGVNIKEALNDFGEFCKGAVLVAHNAQFDIPFIRHHAELNQTNETYINHTVIDTMVFFQANHPELKKFSLEALTRFYHKKIGRPS
ncbi:3'-5' exonuclease [Lactococcus fujiensis]|uniref:3'-5' exonuclease n=1 Tax=Lactococcus fujiensis TaxID=610251 RepID=UPI0006D1A0AA|nr:exonuclease domain-containing protein [Lactococcus fujiensis]